MREWTRGVLPGRCRVETSFRLMNSESEDRSDLYSDSQKTLVPIERDGITNKIFFCLVKIRIEHPASTGTGTPSILAMHLMKGTAKYSNAATLH